MKKLGMTAAFFAISLLAVASGTEDTSSPILTWNTFMGAGGDESANGLTLDASGNIYVVGWASATWGSPVRAYTGNYDAFVAKFSPNGSLLWNTFLGGTELDSCFAVGFDGTGNLYVSGYSNAAWGSPVRAFAGGADQFVAKLGPDGNLIWNAFLGGAGNDYNNSMTVDSSGDCYVVGVSLATWGAPVNPMVVSPAGYRDWTIAKVSSSGALQWNTFHGGTNHDYANGVALDPYGGLYVAGTCLTSWGTPLSSYSGGRDITVVKLSAGTGVRTWHTFLGQSGADNGYGITFGGEGIVVIAGTSDATWGAPFNPYSASTDGVVAALQTDGTFLGHGFYGGTGDDGCVSVALTAKGQVYAGGYSTVGWGSPDRPFGGGGVDGFVVRLGGNGTPQGLSFFGGSGDEAVNAIALDANRNYYAVGTSDTNWGNPIVTFSSLFDGFVVRSTFLPDALTRHAVGDFDGDGTDEAAVDFGQLGVWVYDSGGWSQISTEDADHLAALDIDGSGDDEIVADAGDGGLMLWDSGSISQISANDAEGLAVGDLDANGDQEILADFGATGLWIFDLGQWTQFSAANPDFVAMAELNFSGGQEIVADFGPVGLWIRLVTGWLQASGVNADFFACGDTDATATAEIAVDFGAAGLWLWNAGGWSQLSGVDANYLIMADKNADGRSKIIGDFGPVGLWLWDSGSWTMLSGMRQDFMIAANLDADPGQEVVVDFGTLGLWMYDGTYDGGNWVQLSGVNPDYIMSGDFDGDAQAELLADFGTLGLWVYNGGAWTQVSSVNPD